MNQIDDFRGENFFLSNFYMLPITYEGMEFPSTEHAFQAAKDLDPIIRLRIAKLPRPGQAKRAGGRSKESIVTLREDWETIRVQVMEDVLRLKFADLELREKLLNTGNAELIEGNTWGDCEWGMVKTPDGQWVGKNMLGKLLMKLRSEYAPTV